MTGEIIAFLILNSMAVIGAIVQTFVQGQRLSRQRETLSFHEKEMLQIRDKFIMETAQRATDVERSFGDLRTQYAEQAGYYKARIETLEMAVERKTASIAEYQAQVAELTKSLHDKDETNKMLREDLDALKVRVQSLEEKIAMLSDELKREQEARKKAEAERDLAQKRASEAEAKMEKLALERDEAIRERDELRDELKAQLGTERLEEAVTDEQIT